MTKYHIRKQIQESRQSHQALAKRFGINPKTVLKWKHRDGVDDLPRGTKNPKYTLSKWEQKVIVKLRKHLKLSLDDLVIVVKKYIPKANRSNVYRVLRRHQLNHILTDNGKEFGKEFSKACKSMGIKHKRTKVKHPWTNGQVERMIQTIKKDTVKKKFYQDFRQLGLSLSEWVNDYNMRRKLKSLKFLIPYRKMVEYYQTLNTYGTYGRNKSRNIH